MDGKQKKRLTDLLFEVGMLKKTPRSGYQFLGSGAESVAEHSHRASIIAYILARQSGANILRVLLMALFHDLHEARTGDFNYVNKIYNKCVAEKALADAFEGTGLEQTLMPLWRELEEAETLEAHIAHDADQLDLILNLKQEADLGNRYAGQWMESALARLRTDYGRQLAESICRTDHTDWWRQGRAPSVWINGSGE